MAEVYRGWWVLAGLFLVYAASNGILMHTLPLTYPALIEEFGWDAAEATLPATVLFIVAAVSSPPTGVLLDRYSARLVMLVGALAMVLGLLAFSRIQALWQMVVVFIVFALALSACGIVANMLVLTRWFGRLRGRATGILLLASSLGASVFPLLLGATMAAAGWRTALLMFAGLAAVLAIGPALLLVRDRPDGNAKTLVAEAPSTFGGPTLKAAVREPRFYLVAAATGSIWFVVLALLQHQSIYLGRDVGVTAAALPSVFSVFFAFSVAGKLGFGWLSDRLDKGLTLVASLGVLIASLLLLKGAASDRMPLIYAYAAIGGFGFSGAFTTIQLWIASFYAGASYGKILSIMTMFDTLAGALGVWVAGQVSKTAAGYAGVLNLMMAACVFAAACIVAVRHKERQNLEAGEAST